MQDKKNKIPVLQADLMKYCKQIGITEPPALVFTRDDFDHMCNHESRRHTKKYLGMCCRRIIPLLVNLETRGKIWRDHVWNRKSASL